MAEFEGLVTDEDLADEDADQAPVIVVVPRADRPWDVLVDVAELDAWCVAHAGDITHALERLQAYIVPYLDFIEARRRLETAQRQLLL